MLWKKGRSLGGLWFLAQFFFQWSLFPLGCCSMWEMAQVFGFGDDALEVATVFAVGELRTEGLDLCKGKKPLPKRSFLRTTDFHTLPFFDGLHVGRGFMQAAAGAGVQPREPPTQAMHA